LPIGQDGTATADLAPGEYSLCELEAPIGYALNLDGVSITIKAGGTTKVTITNTLLVADETGELLVIKKAEGTGKPLSGAVFGVYRASDNRKLSEITSGADGAVTLALTPGDYYLLEQTAPSGYALETARISLTVRKGVTVKVEITNTLIGQDKPTPAPTAPANPTIPGISISKTGEDFPTMNYVLAALFLCLSVACGTALYRDRKRAA